MRLNPQVICIRVLYYIMRVLVILRIYLEQCIRSDLELECFLLFSSLVPTKFVHFIFRQDSMTVAGLSFLILSGSLGCYIGSGRHERTEM